MIGSLPAPVNKLNTASFDSVLVSKRRNICTSDHTLRASSYTKRKELLKIINKCPTFPAENE